MVFKFLRDEGSDRLEEIEDKVQQMLAHDRHEFDLAMSALMGDKVASEVNRELRDTDQKVNRLEREIRRQLVVHASVFGGIDTPAVLVYMSIVKDVERVGDYAKNILDLALDGANLSTVPDIDQWRDLAAEVSELITQAGTVFRARDAERCRPLLSRGDQLLDIFDNGVSDLVKGEAEESQAVPRALTHRYLKRVVAHLMNLLSAVVMPLDRLDYFDEDPEDRAR
ncbi:MAG: PhoU domain-containing protein [Gemmatimonadetes bacterium]|nr:PhoU domain-containing protein [Gemmatimonadota bacterium]